MAELVKPKRGSKNASLSAARRMVGEINQINFIYIIIINIFWFYTLLL